MQIPTCPRPSAKGLFIFGKMKELQPFLDDDKILEIAELACRGRILESARLMQYFLLDKWNISTVLAIDMARKLALEFSA